MEEYLNLLIEQIRCKKARPFIREEIQGHIEEQLEDNLLAGMSPAEAEQAAIKDMGNPVEVGIALDRIHKPQIAWGILILMAFISLAAIIIQGILSRSMGEEAIGSSNFALYTIIGFILMLIVYRIDYSMIARLSKIIGAIFIGICGFSLFYGNIAYGMTFSITLLGINVSLFALMTLYVPLYGAILYKYHGEGYAALLKAIMWMLVPVIIAFRLPSLSLAMLLLVSLSVVLTVAIAHDWFKVAKKKVIVLLWICELGLPVAGLTFALLFGLLKSYQADRIKAFLTNNGDANYVTAMLRSILADSRLIGGSGKELADILPDFNSNYILSYVFSTYGLLLGAIICCVLAVLIINIFAISFRQKNQLGMCMGCGCGIIILLNVILNIGENIGLIPITQTFLPFFSTGGSSIIICYILMGIILSIYRYKNIFPTHVSARLPIFKITIDL